METPGGYVCEYARRELRLQVCRLANRLKQISCAGTGSTSADCDGEVCRLGARCLLSLFVCFSRLLLRVSGQEQYQECKPALICKTKAVVVGGVDECKDRQAWYIRGRR